MVWWKSGAKLTALFAIVGFGLGLAALINMGAMGAFDSAFSMGILLGFLLAGTMSTALYGSIILGAVAGVYAARVSRTRPDGAFAGTLGAGAGTIALLAVTFLTVILGVAIFAPSAPDGASGPSDAGGGSASALFNLLWIALPSAMVGGAVGALMHEPRRATTLQVVNRDPPARAKDAPKVEA